MGTCHIVSWKSFTGGASPTASVLLRSAQSDQILVEYVGLESPVAVRIWIANANHDAPLREACRFKNFPAIALYCGKVANMAFATRHTELTDSKKGAIRAAHFAAKSSDADCAIMSEHFAQKCMRNIFEQYVYRY